MNSKNSIVAVVLYRGTPSRLLRQKQTTRFCPLCDHIKLRVFNREEVKGNKMSMKRLKKVRTVHAGLLDLKRVVWT